MRRRRRPRDQEDPNEIIHARSCEVLSPAQVVQSVLGRKTEAAPELVRQQTVQSGALIHFVEMGHGLSREQNSARTGACDRGAVHVVEQALGQVAGGREVLQALLVLDADGGAAEFFGQAHGSDVHAALLERLFLRQLLFIIAAPGELHPPLLKPVQDAARLRIANAERLGVERGLAEAFLEDAGGVEQLVGEDGVEHPHATLIEHAHDGLAPAEFAREAPPEAFLRRREGERVEVPEM